MKKQASKRIQLSGTDSRCGDCSWITERYNLNYKGEPVLGRCPHCKHAVLLDWPACKEFKTA